MKKSLDMFAARDVHMAQGQYTQPIYSDIRPARTPLFSHRVRIMCVLGIVFSFLLSGGNVLRGVQVMESDLSRRREMIFAEIDAAQNAFREKDTSSLQNSIASLQNVLDTTYAALSFPGNGSGDSILTTSFDAAAAVAEAGKSLGELATVILDKKSWWEQTLRKVLSGEESALTLTDEAETTLEFSQKQIRYSLERVQKALSAPLPESVRDQLDSAHTLLTRSEKILSSASQYLGAIRALLGAEHPHTFLVLLQNRNELRATGGFPGSVLAVQVNQGKILSWKFSDIFHFSGQFAKDLPVPLEFAHLTGGWFVHDCNREPDFPVTARQCQNLFEYSKGDTPDTIIAIHNGILEDLLSLTGAVTLPEMKGKELNGKNASLVLSYVVEAKLFGQGGENSPKNILTELIPVLTQRIQNPEYFAGLFDLGQKWRRQKAVQIYSRDESLQKLWNDLEVSGEYIPRDAEDFLGVVQANVGGNKSDAFMEQEIHEKTLVNLDGEMFHTVGIIRKHTWGISQESEFEDLSGIFGTGQYMADNLKNIIGQGVNKVFTRVYFPKGTRLLRAENLSLREVMTETREDFTVFSFFFPQTPAGQTSSVELFVVSPMSVDIEHGDIVRFTGIAQSGTQHQRFSKEFLYETGIRVEGEEFTRYPFTQNIQSVYSLSLE